ncbi:MAG: DMT family transporter [Desulfobacterales bacterium]|nr:DMT family transporter [Desulfobacterales bacterium]
MEISATSRVVIGAMMISFSGVYVKLAHVTPTICGFYRVAFGGIALLVIAIMKKERPWKGLPYLLLGIAGGLFFALDLFVWHRAVHYIGPGLGTILPNFQVFLLAFYGVAFLEERLSRKLLLAMPMSVVGLFLIVGVQWDQLSPMYKTGVLLGLSAAGIYAGYTLILRKLQAAADPLSPVVNLTVISFSSMVFLGMEAWRSGESFFIPDAQSIVSLLAYALFSQVIGWTLISKGLPGIRASLAGLILLLQPALAFVWDILFFEQEATFVTMVGFFLTLGAIYLGTQKGK